MKKKFRKSKINRIHLNNQYTFIFSLALFLSMSYHFLNTFILVGSLESLVKIERPFAKNDFKVGNYDKTYIKIGKSKNLGSYNEVIEIDGQIANIEDIRRSPYSLSWNYESPWNYERKRIILLDIDKDIKMGIVHDIRTILQEQDLRNIAYLTY